MSTRVLLVAVLEMGLVLLFLGGWVSSVQTQTRDEPRPLPGLTAPQQVAFEVGMEEFTEIETFEEGLGPVLNGKGCAEAPLPRRSNDAQTERGERLFAQVGCASCHTRALATGNDAIRALRFRQVELWSDLMLHDMGAGLADGIAQGTAAGNEWRTAPL